MNDSHTISETFAELRKISTGWDDVKCVCDALGRGRCELNCSEHEDNIDEENQNKYWIEIRDIFIKDPSALQDLPKLFYLKKQ